MKFLPATRAEFAIWPSAPKIDPVRSAGRVWRAWIRQLVIRHLRRELSSMPDWLLYDIGIVRTDIPSIAVEIADGSKASRLGMGERQ